MWLKNTGVGSLSLLQQIFLTQELNWGLLHCRWILYQLSHEGSSRSWIALRKQTEVVKRIRHDKEYHLDEVIRARFSEEVIFEQRPE